MARTVLPRADSRPTTYSSRRDRSGTRRAGHTFHVRRLDGGPPPFPQQPRSLISVCPARSSTRSPRTASPSRSPSRRRRCQTPSPAATSSAGAAPAPARPTRSRCRCWPAWRPAPLPRRPGRPRALVLAPTRELATQIEASMAPLAAALSLRVHTVFGGVGAGPQIAALRAGVDVLVACPGRLEDHVRSGHARLDAVEITVLDEADHMADLGFLPVVRRLLDQTPQRGQRLLFSATLDAAVDVLVRRYLVKPVTHSVDSPRSHVPAMSHHMLHVRAADRLPVLVDLTAAPGRSLVFTRTKRGAKVLARRLVAAGVPAVELHGNLAQNARTRNMSAFSEGRVRTLVATDIAARGIHVDDVTLVIHADPPVEHKAYLHRSGRTARAGAHGTVVTLMTDEQVADVRDLARRAGITPTTTRLRVGDPLLAELAPGHALVRPADGRRRTGGSRYRTPAGCRLGRRRPHGRRAHGCRRRSAGGALGRRASGAHRRRTLRRRAHGRRALRRHPLKRRALGRHPARRARTALERGGILRSHERRPPHPLTRDPVPRSRRSCSCGGHSSSDRALGQPQLQDRRGAGSGAGVDVELGGVAPLRGVPASTAATSSRPDRRRHQRPGVHGAAGVALDRAGQPAGSAQDADHGEVLQHDRARVDPARRPGQSDVDNPPSGLHHVQRESGHADAVRRVHDRVEAQRRQRLRGPARGEAQRTRRMPARRRRRAGARPRPRPRRTAPPATRSCRGRPPAAARPEPGRTPRTRAARCRRAPPARRAPASSDVGQRLQRANRHRQLLGERARPAAAGRRSRTGPRTGAAGRSGTGRRPPQPSIVSPVTRRPIHAGSTPSPTDATTPHHSCPMRIGYAASPLCRYAISPV